MSTPAQQGFRMPPEWAPHERVWMAFPRVGPTLGDDRASADEARDTWAAVANAIAEREPVTMVVDWSALGEARRRLAAAVHPDQVLVAAAQHHAPRLHGPH